MSKKTVLIILFFVVSSFVFASSLTYVYGSSFSSVDLGQPHKGSCYRDESGNIFQVSQNRENVTELELVRSVSPIKAGSELYRRGPLFFIGLGGGMKKASANICVSGPLYPLSFTADFDFVYDKTMMAFAGIRTEVPLNIVMESDFTLVKNGSAFAYALAGTDSFDKFSFATKWGLGYRHIIGRFFWSADFNEVWNLSTEEVVSDFSVSAGVML